MKMDLQYFSGSLTVTVYKDSHMTTASASPASSLAKDDSVELTLTPADGYEVADVEVVSGGVTIYDDGTDITFTMGESSVVLNVKSQKNNEYKVVENCFVCVNGTVTNLKRNMKVVEGANGAVVGVECTPSTLTLSADIIGNLLASGVIVKASPAWSAPEPPAET